MSEGLELLFINQHTGLGANTILTLIWWYMTAETKPRVEGQDCGGLTEQARKQLIFLLSDWVVAGLASLSNDILWLSTEFQDNFYCSLALHCTRRCKKCLDWPKTTSSLHTVFQREAQRSWDGIFRKISQMLFASFVPTVCRQQASEARLGKLTWIFLPGYFFVWLEWSCGDSSRGGVDKTWRLMREGSH